MLASPCLAAQREARNRGPSVTERRAVEAAAAEAEQERLEQQRLARRGTASRVVSTALVLSSRNGAGEVPLGTRKLGRGRAAMNTPVAARRRRAEPRGAEGVAAGSCGVPADAQGGGSGAGRNWEARRGSRQDGQRNAACRVCAVNRVRANEKLM